MAKAKTQGSKTAPSVKVVVRQTRSAIGRDPSTISTLDALGLGSIGKSRQITVTKPILGMLRRVEHLVRIDECA